jgi:hypothetical protein
MVPPIFVNLFGGSRVYSMYAAALTRPGNCIAPPQTLEKTMNKSYCHRSLERSADLGLGQWAETLSVHPRRC